MHKLKTIMDIALFHTVPVVEWVEWVRYLILHVRLFRGGCRSMHEVCVLMLTRYCITVIC